MRRDAVSVVSRVAPRRLAVLVLALAAAAAVAIPWSADATNGLWRSRAELASLPTSGAAWEWLKSVADEPLSEAAIANQNSDHDTHTLAAALVYARTGQELYRAKARDGIAGAIGTERGGRTLALGRNLPAYVIAADLVALRSYDPPLDGRFRAWLRAVRTQPLDGRTLIETHEKRPNNWGTHAGAARVAASAYLGDRADLERAAQVFKGWLGDRTAYAGFKFGDLSWQCNPAKPVAINPVGCTRGGAKLDGVLPDDQRRAGGFTWPPQQENYTWGALAGATLQAELLSRQGYDAWEWEDQALRRAVQWLYVHNSFPPTGDDTWIPWVVNGAYGTRFRATLARTGKNMGFTDWTHSGAHQASDEDADQDTDQASSDDVDQDTDQAPRDDADQASSEDADQDTGDDSNQDDDAIEDADQTPDSASDEDA